jgi:hypothetical protein
MAAPFLYRSGFRARAKGNSGNNGKHKGASDPFWSSVVFLSEFEGTDGQNSGFTETKNGRAATFSGTSKISNTFARFGSTSLFVGTGDTTFADNNDWDLSDANSDQFTIEFSARQGTIAFQWDTLNQFGGGGWLPRWQSSGEMTFFWYDNVPVLNNLATSGAGATATDTWYDWCIEKNSAGKIRIYLDGGMKGSATPSDSTMLNGPNPLTFATQATSDGYIDHARITKGVARYDSDGGYTPTTGPFPTH